MMIGRDGIMENTALLTAASLSSSFGIFSSLDRFTAAKIKSTGCRSTIRMVIPQRIAIAELFAISKCDICISS